jgi:hypothetical protein
VTAVDQDGSPLSPRIVLRPTALTMPLGFYAVAD